MKKFPSSSSSASAFLGVTLLGAIVAAFVTTAMFLLLDRYDRSSIQIAAGSHSARSTIVVQIGGEVAVPGVYTIGSHSRLIDVIDAAGGLTSGADPSSLNLAARVSDGESVDIPSRIPATPVVALALDAEPDVETDGPININTATIDMLDTLPGVGPVIGQRIIDYREVQGPFPSIDALAEVDGLSQRSIDRLRPLITVDD